MKNLNYLFVLLIVFATGIKVHAESQLTTGTYEVPVVDADLKSAAQFNLKKVLFTQNGADFEIKYALPTELTGKKNVVQFKGTFNAGQGTADYENSKMDCLIDQDLLMCKVQFKDLDIDQDLAINKMSARFKGLDLTRRLSVQHGFSTDPVGVIKIKLTSTTLALIP